MGSCIGMKDPSIQILTEAHSLFVKIDKKNKNCIEAEDVAAYFSSFSDHYTKILMREMDFNKDGIITKNEWLGYWEMVRRAGYRNSEIKRQLKLIETGELHMNFPRASTYQADEPRETVVQTIVQDLKRAAPADLPFSLQK